MTQDFFALPQKQEAAAMAQGARVVAPRHATTDKRPWYLTVEFFTAALVAVGIIQGYLVLRSDETQRTIQRAFVTPRPIEVEGLRKQNPSDVMMWQITVNWENTGNTATQDLSLYTYFHVKNGTDEQPALHLATPPKPADEAAGSLTMQKWTFTPVVIPFSNWPTPPHKTLLAPHQIRIADQTIYSAASMKRFMTGIASAEIIGIATYNDAFGKKRLTMFCQHMIVPSLDYDNGEPNRALAMPGPDCTEYNCTDEDCRKYKNEVWLPADVIP